MLRLWLHFRHAYFSLYMLINVMYIKKDRLTIYKKDMSIEYIGLQRR